MASNQKQNYHVANSGRLENILSDLSLDLFYFAFKKSNSSMYEKMSRAATQPPTF